MAGEIRYSAANQAEFGSQILEFRIAVNRGFRQIDPNDPADQGRGLNDGQILIQDLIDITTVEDSLKQTNFALTEGESAQFYIGLFDPVREQFLDFFQIDRLTNLDIDSRFFEMDLRVTGFRGDSELVAGDVALLSDGDIAAGMRADVAEFRSADTVLGTPFRTTFRTGGEFALTKLDATDLGEGRTEGDYEGRIFSDGAFQFTPIDAFPEDILFGRNEFVTGIPTVSIQTVNDRLDPGSDLIDPNANTVQEQQAIRFLLDVSYKLKGDATIFTDGAVGDFNYIDLAAGGDGGPDGGDGGGAGDDDGLFFGGTPGPDLLIGGDGDETIIGLGGADTIRGGRGDDQLSGLGGKDRLFGQSGDDSLFGDGGKDTLKGGGGADFLGGGGGGDSLLGGGGADELVGDGGRDILKGGGGNDTLAGEQGANTLTGGGGRDTFLFFGLRATDTVTDLRPGDALLFGAGGDASDLSFQQIGATLRVDYFRTTILFRNTDRDEFDRADIEFADLF